MSFDDSDDDDLYVFSGYDLMISYYDHFDLDWREVAERTLIDERRGLVVLQVAVLEDLVDEFILYLADDPNQNSLYEKLTRQTLGPRIDRLERLMRDHGLLDAEASGLLADLRNVTERRNELAHGVIRLRPVDGKRPPLPRDPDELIELEWVIISRRTGTTQRITMSGLRDDLYEAIGCFNAMLGYADSFIEKAPRPVNFAGGRYIAPPQ